VRIARGQVASLRERWRPAGHQPGLYARLPRLGIPAQQLSDASNILLVIDKEVASND
jgi:hypothetical protein